MPTDVAEPEVRGHTELADDSSTLERLVREAVAAIVAPRSFARSLLQGHHALSSVIAALASSAALALAVDVMTVASADSPAALGTLAVDVILFALIVAIAVAVAALGSALATRLAGPRVRTELAYTAIAFALGPLLLSPIAAVLALAGWWTLALVAIAALLARCMVSLGLDLAAVMPGRRAWIGGAIAVVVLTFALADRLNGAAIAALTMEPAVLPALPAAPSGGVVHRSGSFTLTLPAAWSRASTGTDIARFEREVEDVRIIRERRAQLESLADAADRTIERELRAVRIRESSRSFWRAGSDLLIEDIRAGSLDEREVAFVLFMRRTSDGPIGLLFRIVGPHDRAASLELYRSIALTLRAGD